MKKPYSITRFLSLVGLPLVVLLIGEPARAVDDGPRTYWKTRAGTNIVSVQYLNLHLLASDSLQFDPTSYIYPAADVSADIFLASFARHMTLFNRPTVVSANVVAGSVHVDFDTSRTPPAFLPPGVVPSTSFSQATSGYADPAIQIDMNLFGTPPLNAGFDLLNYEPKWTLDVAVMLGIPVGEYDSDKVVNLGLNRTYGRIAFPFKYHFGVFAPGYMRSLEIIPSVWLFGENDDYVGQKLDNDPLWQLEAHWTQDFTRHFYGSIDLLYRKGFQSKFNGIDVGDDLEVGDIGFTLNYQVTDNLTLRTSYSSNVFGNNKIDNSLIRFQIVYGWNQAMQNLMKLGRE